MLRRGPYSCYIIGTSFNFHQMFLILSKILLLKIEKSNHKDGPKLATTSQPPKTPRSALEGGPVPRHETHEDYINDIGINTCNVTAWWLVIVVPECPDSEKSVKRSIVIQITNIFEKIFNMFDSRETPVKAQDFINYKVRNNWSTMKTDLLWT